MTALAAPPQLPPPGALPMRPFTVDEYHRLIETGILTDEDAVELLEGWIALKMPRNPPHDAVLSRLLNRILGPRLPGGWFCRGQSAMSTADSAPEPDVAVVRGDEFDYLNRHPTAADMALVVEVADTTLARDRGLKARIYARAGVPVYWIVNLGDAVVEAYTDPTGPAGEPAYRRRQDFAAADVLPLLLEGREVGTIPVRELLP